MGLRIYDGSRPGILVRSRIRPWTVRDPITVGFCKSRVSPMGKMSQKFFFRRGRRGGWKSNEKVKKSMKNQWKTNKKREGGPRGPQGAPTLSLFVGFPMVFLDFRIVFKVFGNKTKSVEASLVLLPTLLVSLCLWFLLGPDL